MDGEHHPVRLWGGLVIGTMAALGIGWGLFVKMEEYDLALVSLSEQIGDLQALVQQNDKRLTQENEDWWADDKAQYGTIMATLRLLAADHRQINDATRDLYFAIGKHEGEHKGMVAP